MFSRREVLRQKPDHFRLQWWGHGPPGCRLGVLAALRQKSSAGTLLSLRYIPAFAFNGVSSRFSALSGIAEFDPDAEFWTTPTGRETNADQNDPRCKEQLIFLARSESSAFCNSVAKMVRVPNYRPVAQMFARNPLLQMDCRKENRPRPGFYNIVTTEDPATMSPSK